MRRRTGLQVIGLLAMLAAMPLAIGTGAQSSRAVTPDTRARDLATATPESVGVSTERLRRLEGAMKRVVDDKQIAGVVTLLARHGKVVHFNAVGQKDARKPDPIQKDSIFRIYSMTKPVTGVAMMMLCLGGRAAHNGHSVDRTRLIRPHT